LVAYYDLGATSLLIRGYDPLTDAVEYGRELIPRVRALVAERDTAQRDTAALLTVMRAQRVKEEKDVRQ
jgi:alkanesulfonate monooxygenase